MDEPMITDDERRDIVERLKSERIPNLLGLYSAILGEEEKNNTYKLYQKLIKLIEPQSSKLNDYIDCVNDAISTIQCNAILQGHLKGIARRCGVNPDKYHDSASLTFAIVDVLDKRLISESEITSIELFDDGTNFVQCANGWSYGYKNKLNYEKRLEKYENDIINWVNDNGGIEKVKQYVRVAKNVEGFVNGMYGE